MYGIYINTELTKSGREADYIELIMLKIKTLETRDKDVFKSIIGERVALLDSSKYNGATIVRGFVTLLYSFNVHRIYEYNSYMEEHCVFNDSVYYWNDNTSKKVMYALRDPKRAMYWMPRKTVNHGRSYIEFNEEELIPIV